MTECVEELQKLVSVLSSRSFQNFCWFRGWFDISAMYCFDTDCNPKYLNSEKEESCVKAGWTELVHTAAFT